MASFPAGKKLFNELKEYPLPKKEGSQDYLFYFVPASDGYGKGARYFMDRFYKKHRRKEVSSLEALISHLHSEVKSQAVTHIREIIIVAHGNAQGLLFPILNTVPEAEPNYKYLTPLSLTLLQKDFLDGKLAEFNGKRKEVIARLTNDSWVTIRACNFGQSKAGMYAFYSFFGGTANVYAPVVYQFFGSHPIMQGMRLETKLKVHEHLVKQRFLPRDVHTPDRKDAVVKFLIDRARFTQPFPLATMELDNTTAPEAVQYEQVIDELNRRKITDFIKTRFSEKGMLLTGNAKVLVKSKDTSWIIRDSLTHENVKYTIEYYISEEIGFNAVNKKIATLSVEAKIPDAYSAAEFFPIQLFFYEGENNQWRGRLFTLAFYTEETNAPASDKQKFDAVLGLLTSNTLRNGTAGGADIFLLFKAESIDLSAGATVTLLSATGTGAQQRKTWLLTDTQQFLIKLEHPYTAEGIPAHTLTVYKHSDKRSRLREEYELMSYLGEDPDLPGTELLAYLDKLSLDELSELIDHLRNPYKPEHVVYIHHALQALHRKKEYFTWFNSRSDVQEARQRNDPLFPLGFPYYDLSLSESEDNRTLVYDFDTNTFWKEVKASNPTATAFQQDLFTEEVLKFSPAQLAASDNPEADSPYTDIEELRAIETQGIEHFFAEEKFTLETPPTEEISCAEFAEIITQLKGFTGKTDEEIEEALETIKVAGDKPLSYYLYNTGRSILSALGFMNALKGTGGIPETVVSFLIKRFPALGAAPELGAPYLVTLTRAMPYIGIVVLVGQMFANYLKEYAHTLQVWEEIGKITALRQWSRRLQSLTYKKDTFPTTVSIDLVGYATELKENNPLFVYLNNPYYIALYYEEQLNERGKYSAFIFSPEGMKKGFDEGAKLIEKEANDILAKAEEIAEDALRQSGLDSCKIHVLRETGIFDPAKVRAIVMRQYAEQILEKVPKV